MDIFESIKLSIEGLKTNKMRSFLTMLGIIIGIASVIGIMTIGDAMTNFVNDEFSSMSNQFQLMVNPKGESNDYNPQESDMVSDTMIENIEEKFGSRLEAIVISGPSFSGEVKDDRKDAPVRIESTSEGTKSINNVKMQAGRFLTEDDILEEKGVAVISSEVVKEIFGGDYGKAIGSEIDVDTDGNGLQVFSVVGIYKYETSTMQSMMGGNADKPTTNIYIPYTVGNRISPPEKEGYQYLMMSAKDSSDVATLSSEITEYLNSNYYAENDNYETIVYTAESELSTINQMMSTMNIAIGAIAAISLLVGGIGVMNILLVSVTERTREIGVRKALGATNNNIRSQFIVESIILCIIGGAIGVVLGGGLGYAGSSLFKAPTTPSMTAIMVAVGFSTFIGVFFGYYPANKAAKLNPIDALRYE